MKKKRSRSDNINQLTRLFWVGSAADCRHFFAIHHFDYIVSVDFSPDEGYKGAQKRHFPMLDLSNLTDKYKVEQVRQTIIHVVTLLLEITNRGKSVFLHCQVGQSRSISIAIAYIMVAFQKSPLEAQRYVFHHRPVAHVKRELVAISVLAAEKSIPRGENPIVDEIFEYMADESMDTERFIAIKIPW